MAITRAVANATATSAQFNEIIDHLEGDSGSTLAYFLRVLSSNNFTIRLPDAGGTQEFRIQDSAGVTVGSIDSDGNVAFIGATALTGNLDVGGTLELGSSNITTSTAAGLLKHEAGGLEFDASAITTGGLFKGASSGTAAILAKGAANTVLKMAAAASDFAWTATPGATLVGKPSAETVNNSTTLQDDDTLKFTGAADTNYSVMGCFRFQSIEAADFKWAMTAAGSSTIDLGAVYYNVAGSTTTTNAAWTFLAEDASVSTVGFGATAPYVASFFMGTVLMDGSGGEVAVQWAQHSAVASNTQMLPGAWIRYEAI